MAEALSAQNMTETEITVSLDILAQCGIRTIQLFEMITPDEFNEEVLKQNKQHLSIGLRKALVLIHKHALSPKPPPVPTTEGIPKKL